jgi:hypothetical protein
MPHTSKIEIEKGGSNYFQNRLAKQMLSRINIDCSTEKIPATFCLTALAKPVRIRVGLNLPSGVSAYDERLMRRTPVKILPLFFWSCP